MSEIQLQWFATLGVGGIVAAFMFMFYRQDVKRYLELWQEQATQNRAVVSQVLDVVRDNTAVLNKLISTVDSLHRRIDSNREYLQRDPR